MHDQNEIIAFIEQGGLGPSAERIETHAAIVFLVGERAFKLKKAVRYSFLDFSTLERRQRALEAELALNRRTAPALYRRLVPITREADGRLALAGQGEVVEWLLEMVRFPAEARLDRIAQAGGLEPRLAERLGEIVAELHARAAIRRDKGGASGLEAVIRGNAADLRALVPDIFPSDAVETVCRAIEAGFARAAQVLEARRAAGLVRHGHGDLHLENIVVLDGEPLPFDCLEFDENLACVDVLYDLAFLLMDLRARGLVDAARLVLQAWADARLDDRDLHLLPLLIAVRAQVRAKVEGLCARSAQSAAAAQRHREAARRYLELARAALTSRPVLLLAVGGRSGTGKSGLAQALAATLGPQPGALVLRSDVIRKRLFAHRPYERLGEEAYRSEVTRRVFSTIAARAELLVRAGWAVVCDAVYGLPEQRAALAQAARRAGVPFRAFWLDAPQEVLEARVARRVGDASDADVAVVRRQSETVVPPTPEEGWLRIDASGSAQQTLAQVQAALAEFS